MCRTIGNKHRSRHWIDLCLKVMLQVIVIARLGPQASGPIDHVEHKFARATIDRTAETDSANLHVPACSA